MKQKKAKANTHYKVTLFSLLIIFATLLVYLPAFKHGLLNWDDNLYVTDNAFIRNFSSIPSYFDRFFFGNYHPLTIFSYSILYHISKLNPLLYHLYNILLHIANALLIFFLIKALFKNINLSFIVALLFAIHPMHVESVAWISELKDVQYTFFYLISLWFYLKFVHQQKKSYYIFSILFFILSLLSKGQAVTLSLVILLIDYRERGKMFTKLTEKIPYFLLSFVFGIVAIMAQKSGNTLSDFSIVSPWEQIALACYSFFIYILKLIFPFQLSAFYPYPALINGNIPEAYWFSLIIIPITAYILWVSYKKNNTVFWGFLFFIVHIFLLLQLIPVGNCIMADRYSYIPSIGIFIIVAQGLLTFLNKSKQKFMLISICSIYGIYLCAFTYHQTQYWKDDFSLWNSVLSVYPNIPSALVLRGYAYNEAEEYQKALVDLNKAISINPKDGLAYLNRGVSKAKLGDFSNAIADFKKAETFNLEKRYQVKLYSNLGGALANVGNLTEAMKAFDKAIELNPNDASAYNNRGIANAMLGNRTNALKDFDTALKLNPAFTDALINKNKILQINH